MGLLERVHPAAKAPVGVFSNQSMQQAFGLLAGVHPGAAGQPPTRGTVEFLRAYSQMPWLRAVTSRIATATATAQWKLFATQKKGTPKAYRNRSIQRADLLERRSLLKAEQNADGLREIVDHPLLDVLHDANEFQTGFQMRKVTQLHLDLAGDCFWLKERDGQGMVIGVWPIPPHWVLATPTPVFRFFRVGFKAWRGNIPDTEFVWFSDPDPLNPYGRGSGAAMALGDELDTDEYAARHTKAFFYNSGRPDLIISPKGPGLTDGNVKRVEEDWMNKTSGFWRAFKPYFTTREVEVKELKNDFRSQQFVQLREFERNVVLQHYGVPPEVLGVIENSNRSTIDTADYLMAHYVIEPRLEFQRQVLQERLVPEYDERLIIEYVSPVQEDKTHRLDVAKAAPFALSVDEWRDMLGQAPHKDKAAGLLHAVPTLVHLQPIEEYEAPPPPTVMGPGMRPPGQAPKPKPKPKPAKSDDWRLAVHDDIAVAVEAKDASLAAALTLAIAEVDDIPVPSQEAERLEPSLQRSLMRCWHDHAARLSLSSLSAAFESDGVAGDAVDALDLTSLNVAQDSIISAALTRAFIKGADVGAAPLSRAGVHVRRPGASVTKPDVAVDLGSVHAQAAVWASEHAGALAILPSAARAVVLELVATSIVEGIAPRELAKLLRSVIGLRPDQVAAVTRFRARLAAEGLATDALERRVARYAEAQLRARALLIARTELIAALNQGQMALWRGAAEQGVIRAERFDKVWITTPDDRLCPACEAMDEEQVPMDEDFSGGVDAPPEHPACRCAIGLVEREVAVAAAVQSPAPMPSIHVEVHAPPAAIVPAPVVTVTQQAAPQLARRRTFTYDADDRVASTTDELIPQKETE